VTATLAGFAVTFAITGAILAAVIWADTWWQARRDRHTEPPSRLDALDGINPPADRHPDPLPPGVGSAGRSAGATTDPWVP
jgi:hypothetical protein